MFDLDSQTAYELVKQYLDEHLEEVVSLYQTNVRMQPAKHKELRLMNIDRVPQFLQRVLEKGYGLVEGGVDILADGEVERMKIYIRVYLFDFLDSNCQ